MNKDDLVRMKTVWGLMKRRCDNVKRFIYCKSYWGRGIKVCDRWMEFENFIEDMGIGPKGYVIDRINGNGNYEPGNCRWVTPEENRKNRNPKEMISKYIYEIPPVIIPKKYEGIGRIINIDADSLRDRIYKAMMNTEGLTIEKVSHGIGVSTYTLRRFLKNTASRYTTPMRLKVLRWLEIQEESDGIM